MTIPTRALGRTGVEVSVLGYGAMELRGPDTMRGPEISDEQAAQLLNGLLDAGVNLVDTSIDYGRSEELIGRYLSSRRDEFFLASKCGCPLTIEPDWDPPATAAAHAFDAGPHPGRRRAEPSAPPDRPPGPAPGTHVSLEDADGVRWHGRDDGGTPC